MDFFYIYIGMKIRWPLLVFFIPVFAAGLALSFNRKNTHPTFLPVIKSAVFDCPTLDTRSMVIVPSDCSGSNGSIVGIQGNGYGTLKFTWYDANNTVVGTSADLTGVPSGQYKVVLTDDDKCAQTVSGSYYIPIKNEVKIDFASAVIKSPGCNKADGSITGINITNAVKYVWTDYLKNVVSTAKDLTNVDVGAYVLTAYNAAGCFAQARYVIDPGTYAPVISYYGIIGTACANRGTFHATFNMRPTDPLFFYSIADLKGKEYFSGALAYQPLDSTRIIIPEPTTPGHAPNPGLPVGTYTLTTLGGPNCFTKLLTFTIPYVPYAIDTSEMRLKTDVCGQDIGAAVNIKITGGPPPSVKFDGDPSHGYFWLDSTGKRYPPLEYIAGVPGGTYTFTAVNSDGCKAGPITIVIPKIVSKASKPIANDVTLCLPGLAVIKVTNRDDNATYHLYDENMKLVLTNQTGTFMPHVTRSTVFYIGAKDGVCESPLGKVNVTVAAPGISVPNVFTPNHDGINDTWEITGLAAFPGTDVSVYNRAGAQVYHSVNYSKQFDGTYHGTDLDAGVYYYVINVPNPLCKGAISGTVTILR